MADMQQDDTQTTTAVEAAADRALWKAVERGDVEVRDSDGDLILTAFNDKTRVAGRYLNNSGDEYWFMYGNDDLFTVHRVQPAQATPAGDGVQATPETRAYAGHPDASNLTERELGQLFVQQAVSDLADFLPPPTDAEVITFLSAHCNLLRKLYEDRGAELATLRAQLAAANAERDMLRAYAQGIVDRYPFDERPNRRDYDDTWDGGWSYGMELAHWQERRASQDILAALRADTEADDAVAEDSAQRSV